MNNTLHFVTLLIQNISDKNGLLQPKFKYEIDEVTVIYTGFDYLHGTKSGLYGQFKEQNRMILGIETIL